MRHFVQGEKFYLSSRGRLLAISGMAAITSLGGAYLLTPSAAIHGRQHLSNSLSLAQTANVQAEERGTLPTALPPTQDANNTTSTKITVNGQSIPVPDQGTVRQVVPSDGGQTTVEISVDHRSTVSQDSSSRAWLNISSHSSSYTESVHYDEHSPPL